MASVKDDFNVSVPMKLHVKGFHRAVNIIHGFSKIMAMLLCRDPHDKPLPLNITHTRTHTRYLIFRLNGHFATVIFKSLDKM